MYPWCIIAQWTTFGLLIGWWLSRRHARAVQNAQDSTTGLDVTSAVKQIARVRQDYVAALHSHPHPTSHPARLVAQARKVLAHLPCFRSKLTQSLPADDHDELTHIP
jgi:hypothetical protein